LNFLKGQRPDMVAVLERGGGGARTT
jgi:hypothetical protein